MGYQEEKIYVIMPEFEGEQRVSVSGGGRITMEEFEKIDTSKDKIIEVNFV